MKIRLSKYCDFCFGVKRAVRLIEQTLSKAKQPVYSLGPFIHNPQVVNQLAQRGLQVVSNLSTVKGGTLVIRSHGIAPNIIKRVNTSSIKLLDVTCPNVKKSQQIVKGLVEAGYQVVIVGDRSHPEVKSLVGQAKGKAKIVSRLSEIERLGLNGARVGIIAQTTQSRKRYLEILNRLLERDFSEVKIYNTICEDTLARQKQAHKVARGAQVMLVLGGRMSANSRRLAQICRAAGTPTYHIETSSQIKFEWLKGKDSVGIASGASTPKWIIDQTVQKIKSLNYLSS